MQDILFDSRLELDRLPLGAVTEKSSVRLGVRVKTELGASALTVRINADDGSGLSSWEMHPVWTEKGYTRFEATVSISAPGLYWFWFTAQINGEVRKIGRDGRNAVFTEHEPCPWQLTVCSLNYTTPDWIKGGVFYHIFVDRFNKSGELPLRNGSVARKDWGGTPVFEPDEHGEVKNNDFFGGNLAGIIEKLPYLHELGVTCIYLSPVFEAASNHKYDTSDYMKIDPSFGDEKDFETLCNCAAEIGMRVICDGVFNHTGDDSVYFDRYGNYGGNGAYNSKESPYYQWFSFYDWPEKYEAWWGIKTLPQVREDNPEYRRFIFGEDGVLRHWMRAGAAGWRLDVADELPGAFLEELRLAVKTENPDALIIGEVWEDATTKVAYGHRRHYLEGRELDTVMNYPFKNAIIDYIMSGNAAAIAETVERICENYPKPALDCLMNGLGTHDTPRILTVLGGRHYASKAERAAASLDEKSRKTAFECLKLAVVLQCTLPGVPCIYYGDEAGLEGYEDPLNRRCFPWGDEDRAIFAWYNGVLRVRRSESAFADGEYRTIFAENGIYAFVRQNGDGRIAIAVNQSSEETRLRLGDKMTMLIAEKAVFGGGDLILPPCSCAVVKL